METLQQWYKSPEYAEALAIRSAALADGCCSWMGSLNPRPSVRNSRGGVIEVEREPGAPSSGTLSLQQQSGWQELCSCVRYEFDMPDPIQIRPARNGDSDFVAGLASSLLEFGSPAWEDLGALAPRFRKVLAETVRNQDQRSTVFIAEGEDSYAARVRLAEGEQGRGGQRTRPRCGSWP